MAVHPHTSRALSFLAAFLIATLTGSSAVAQLTEAQAQKALRQAANAEGKQHKLGLAAAVKQLQFALGDLEDDIDGGALTVEDVATDTGAALDEFARNTVGNNWLAMYEFDLAATDLLDQLPDTGHVPSAFQVGNNGMADHLAARIRRQVDRATRKATAVVQAFTKRVAQGDGLEINAVLQPTRDGQPIAPVFGGDSVALVNFPFALEVLVAVSDPLVPDDGVMAVSGQVPGNLGEEVMLMFISDSIPFFEGPWPLDEGSRFFAVTDGPTDGLSETSFKVVVDFDGAQISRSITMP